MKAIALIIPLVLQTFAIATPAYRRDDGSNPCTTTPLQCCESTHTTDSALGKALLQLSGHEDYIGDGDIGIGCSPLGGNTCTEQPNCCNVTGTFITIGCVPINI
ncbi:hypothetical protein NM688_g8692 [Phlebia brevispora]|uniref:Uncharacterized protein n=1 Tax=Phlebia brevispora TaxID=194682 RepID=A0ACC1RP96_9APHY|nr:hypothetical protein NM688_g8692 [Phlebia brevispora]